MASAYSKLNIFDREMIKPSIEDYLSMNCESYSIKKVIPMANNLWRFNFEVNGEELFLDFYYNNGGTTTIKPSSGKNAPIKDDIAEYLKNHLTSIVDVKNSLVIRGIKKEDFEDVISLLIADDPLLEEKTVTSLESKDKNVSCNYVILGKQGDSVKVTFYKSGTLLMQGKPMQTFNELMVLFYELFLDAGEIVNINNVTYKARVEKKDVESLFDEIMTDCKDKLPDKLCKVIKQSIYNTIVEGDMYDYTFLIYPILRAVEGHIKYIAKDNKLIINGNIGSLYKYDKNLDQHFLIESLKVSKDIKKYLEKQYAFYKENRNVYMHWNDVETVLDTTVFVKDINSAKQIIFDKLKDINYYYTICQ
jgi:ribonuclease HI